MRLALDAMDMSRTYRKPRPKFYGPSAPLPRRVADGDQQYVDTQCRHNNGCDWCRNGRTHASQRRAPIAETPN